MWTQRDQFSNKQLTFFDDHLNIRLYKHPTSPTCNRELLKSTEQQIHYAWTESRPNPSYALRHTMSKVFKVPSDLADSIQIRRPYDTDDVDK